MLEILFDKSKQRNGDFRLLADFKRCVKWSDLPIRNKVFATMVSKYGEYRRVSFIWKRHDTLDCIDMIYSRVFTWEVIKELHLLVLYCKVYKIPLMYIGGLLSDGTGGAYRFTYEKDFKVECQVYSEVCNMESGLEVCRQEVNWIPVIKKGELACYV